MGAKVGRGSITEASSSRAISNDEQQRAQKATSPTMVRKVERRRCKGVSQVGQGSPIFFSSIGISGPCNINDVMLNRTFLQMRNSSMLFVT